MEWFHKIPKNGFICKCKQNSSDDHYKIDIITRYNDHPLSDFKFRNNNTCYADATPVSVTEIINLIYDGGNDE